MNVKFWYRSLLSRFGNDERVGIPRLLARLIRDEEGSYLLYMTLTIPIFIGLAAVATEGALIFYNHRDVQSAADSAAYSAAIAYSLDNSISSTNLTTQAQAIVASYGFTVGTGNGLANVPPPTVDTTTYSPLTAINVTVTRPQLPILSSLWVSNPFNVSGSATAIISGAAGGGSSNCMLGLAPTGSDIALQGTPTITAPNCGIFSNSTSDCSGSGKSFTPSIDLGGHGTVTAGSVGAAGCISVTGSSTIGPPPDGYTSGDNRVINPYAGVTTSTPGTPGSCTNDTVIKNAIQTLNPGTFCTTNPNKNGAIEISNFSNVTLSTTSNSSYVINGDFNVKDSILTLGAGTYTFDGSFNLNNSTVTLGSGTYIFNGPVQFTVDSQSTLTGIGVTLAFTDPGSATYPKIVGQPTAMNFQSGATIDLQAPTSGATQGMLIIGNSNIPLDTAFNLQANAAGVGFQGVIYLPTADMTWGGGPIVAGGCTQMIAYRLIMQGSAVFDNSNCNLSGSGGGGGAKPIGNVVTLVK
jgi:Flp pilus assembly protein TadG